MLITALLSLPCVELSRFRTASSVPRTTPPSHSRQYGPHSEQTDEDPCLRPGEKMPPDFLFVGANVPLEIEHLFGELRSDAGSYVLSGQGSALGSGYVESILGEAIGSF